MNLKEKIEEARKTIDLALSEFKRTAIMCSFGKDSMVLLHLVRQMRELPIIFHREAMQPHKYAFANSVIEEWGLTVFDYPACLTQVQEGETEFEVVNHYQVGQRTCAMPTGIREPKKGESFACGLTDLYLKPLGTFGYPWDLVFHGHKSSDTDPIYGPIPLAADFARNIDSVSAAFPLRHFTDADVWEYTENEGLPIHDSRYEKIDGEWREREDKTNNPDYITACVACMKTTSPAAVPCPKLNHRFISNVSSQLRRAEIVKLPYMGGN